MAFALSGCAGSFEEARPPRSIPSNATVEQAAAIVSVTARCQQLDDDASRYSGAAKFWGALAGGSGISTIPADDKGWRIGLATGAAVSAALAIAADALAHGSAVEYVKECSQ